MGNPFNIDSRNENKYAGALIYEEEVSNIIESELCLILGIRTHKQ